MSKRTVFTTVTPLPAGITRETVLNTLHSHCEIIDLNPLVEERHPIKPPSNASPEEYHCVWYSLTDRVSYLPGGMMSGQVTYNCCFHDLERGLQTHCYAPMGLNIKGKWTLGGSLPGEPIAPMELGLGAPLHGLYIREDVDMKCNIMMTSFVKKTLKKAHSTLVGRLLIKAQILEASQGNQQINDKNLTPIPTQFTGSQASTEYSPSEYADSPRIEAPQIHPIQGLGFRGHEHADDFREKSIQNEPALYPQALNVRSSVSSHNGSIGSQQRRSCQESPPTGRDQRVSWQNLNTKCSRPLQYQQLSTPSQSPSMQHIDPAYQNANPCRVSAQSFHAELPVYESTIRGQPEPQFVSRPPGYHTPPQHGHAELE